MSDDDDDVAIPKEKSIAHHYMPSKMVYLSFDVNTGREYCGIIHKHRRKMEGGLRAIS